MRLTIVARATSAAALVACGGSLPHPAYMAQRTAALIEVTMAPPPGRVESVPARPPGAAVWVDGEWVLRRARWAWSPGRWVVAASGATFSPWAFVRGADGRLWYAPGAWHDAKGAALEPPSPIQLAQVDAADVVNAAGESESTGPTLRVRDRKPEPSP